MATSIPAYATLRSGAKRRTCCAPCPASAPHIRADPFIRRICPNWGTPFHDRRAASLPWSASPHGPGNPDRWRGKTSIGGRAPRKRAKRPVHGKPSSPQRHNPCSGEFRNQARRTQANQRSSPFGRHSPKALITYGSTASIRDKTPWLKQNGLTERTVALHQGEGSFWRALQWSAKYDPKLSGTRRVTNLRRTLPNARGSPLRGIADRFADHALAIGNRWRRGPEWTSCPRARR